MKLDKVIEACKFQALRLSGKETRIQSAMNNALQQDLITATDTAQQTILTAVGESALARLLVPQIDASETIAWADGKLKDNCNRWLGRSPITDARVKDIMDKAVAHVKGKLADAPAQDGSWVSKSEKSKTHLKGKGQEPSVQL